MPYLSIPGMKALVTLCKLSQKALLLSESIAVCGSGSIGTMNDGVTLVGLVYNRPHAKISIPTF